MYASIDPRRAPLRGYKSDHLRLIKERELLNNLAERGIALADNGDGSVRIDLQHLVQRSGSVKQAQLVLTQTLRELGVDAVSLEPQDITRISGGDVFSHATARGLESSIPGLVNLLTDIPISEDNDGDDFVPIFDRLDKAAVFIATDVQPDPAINEGLKQGARYDLTRAGLLDRGNDNYADFLEPRKDEPAELTGDFANAPKPYRSPFDYEGGF